MGNVSLTASRLRGGAWGVLSGLNAGASPNKEVNFPHEDVGPLPRGCSVTPLGFAILADNAWMLRVLLYRGADVGLRIGLPHEFAFVPLHLAVVLGRAAAVRLLLAHGADPNEPLRTTFFGVVYMLQPTWFPWSCSILNSMSRTNAGDTPLHLAMDYGAKGAVVRALATHAATDVNACNVHGRTPLYKACQRRSLRCAKLLAAHPQVVVDAGGCSPLFAAIRAESPQLVRLLLAAGSKADGSTRSGSGQTPLQCAVYRESLMFHSRATIVMLLVRAGASVEPAMVRHAQQRMWHRVHAALSPPAGSGGAAASGGGGQGEGDSGASVASGGQGSDGGGGASSGSSGGLLHRAGPAGRDAGTWAGACVRILSWLVLNAARGVQLGLLEPLLGGREAAARAWQGTLGTSVLLTLCLLVPCALLLAAAHVLSSLAAMVSYCSYSGSCSPYSLYGASVHALGPLVAAVFHCLRSSCSPYSLYDASVHALGPLVAAVSRCLQSSCGPYSLYHLCGYWYSFYTSCNLYVSLCSRAMLSSLLLGAGAAFADRAMVKHLVRKEWHELRVALVTESSSEGSSEGGGGSEGGGDGGGGGDGDGRPPPYAPGSRGGDDLFAASCVLLIPLFLFGIVGPCSAHWLLKPIWDLPWGSLWELAFASQYVGPTVGPLLELFIVFCCYYIWLASSATLYAMLREFGQKQEDERERLAAAQRRTPDGDEVPEHQLDGIAAAHAFAHFCARRL